MTGALHTQFAEALQAAEAAINAGNLEEAQQQRQRAESLKSHMDELSRVASLRSSYAALQPQRPPLPGTQEGAELPQADPPPPAESPLIRAAYINRLGTPEQEIEQILVDLHGPTYAGQYWKQKALFNRYLRHGDLAIAGEDRSLLRTIIFTPDTIKTALRQGVDSVSTFKTTMVEAADTLGGYIVPVDMQSRIIERLRGITVVRGRASVVTTSRDRIEMPRMVDTGGDTTDRYTSPMRTRWVDETPSSLEAQYLSFGMAAVSVHTSMVEAFLSRNLLEDAAFPLEDWLTIKFAEAAAFDEDDQFLFGNGVGKPLGILPGRVNSLNLVEVASGAANAPFFTWDQLLAVPYAIPLQYRNNAAWYMNRRTVLRLHQLKNPESGEYYWRNYNIEGGDAGPQRQLLGYDVLEQEGFADVANGAYPIVFGDLGAYQIVDRVGMTVERYVDSATARQNLVCYVMRRRVGGQLLEPWRMVAVRIATS